MKVKHASVEETNDTNDAPRISLQEFIDGAPYSRVLIAGLESWCKTHEGPRKRTSAGWVQAFEEFSSMPSE